MSNFFSPSKVRVVPNCKLAKVTHNLSEQNYQKLLDGKSRKIVEKKHHKKFGEILSEYTISNVDGFDNSDPLFFFDYSVLSVCISESLAGNNILTLPIILRGLTGKSTGVSGGTANGAVNSDQRNAIIVSIEKLMSTIVKYNCSDANKKLGYNDSTNTIITDTILPCHFATSKINGQVVNDTIFLDRPSPFFTIADQRNQIIRYDVDLLDVPNQNNTPLVITLKNYILLRICEIKLHKMTPTITFHDVFKKARIFDKDNKTKLRARDYAIQFFKHLQDKGFIKSFEIIKKRNQFYSVKFTF